MSSEPGYVLQISNGRNIGNYKCNPGKHITSLKHKYSMGGWDLTQTLNSIQGQCSDGSSLTELSAGKQTGHWNDTTTTDFTRDGVNYGIDKVESNIFDHSRYGPYIQNLKYSADDIQMTDWFMNWNHAAWGRPRLLDHTFGGRTGERRAAVCKNPDHSIVGYYGQNAGEGDNFIRTLGYFCGPSDAKYCINHPEDQSCFNKNLSENTLVDICNKKFTKGCTRDPKVYNRVKQDRILHYCRKDGPNLMTDDFCACLRPIPEKILKTNPDLRMLGGNGQKCWNTACATSGWQSKSMENSACPSQIKICRQDSEIAGKANISEGNVQIMNCDDNGSGNGSGNGNTDEDTDEAKKLAAQATESPASKFIKQHGILLFIIFVVFAIGLVAYSSSGEDEYADNYADEYADNYYGYADEYAGEYY